MATLGYPYYSLGITMTYGGTNSTKSIPAINLPVLTDENRETVGTDLQTIAQMFVATSIRNYGEAKLTTTEEVK